MEKIIVHSGNGAKRNQASVGVMLRDELNCSCLIPFGVPTLIPLVLTTFEYFHALALIYLYKGDNNCRS